MFRLLSDPDSLLLLDTLLEEPERVLLRDDFDFDLLRSFLRTRERPLAGTEEAYTELDFWCCETTFLV